jgi:NADPH-dependent ferric siderophore reductase
MTTSQPNTLDRAPAGPGPARTDRRTDRRTYGRIESVLLKLVARPATVTGVETLGPRFRRLTLAGAALQGVAWQAGDKVQMPLGGFVSRTYTPLSWDSQRGETQLLAYLHGDAPHAAPGTAWAAGVARGDACQVFGPRSSLKLAQRTRNAVFFGDETSFAAAAAFNAMSGWLHKVSFVFEVSQVDECRPVLQALNLREAVLVPRAPDGVHLAEVDGQIDRLAAATRASDFVLTGQAGSIQHLVRALRQRGKSSADLVTKAYWAVGKSGLD